MQTQTVEEFARAAHAGQVDRLGRDYFTAHVLPIAAGASLFGERAVQAALLHDVVEDTSITLDDLRTAGVDPEVISAVDSVSRRPGESYTDFIGRAMRHPVGKVVKLVDNAWNIMSNPELAEFDPELARTLLEERYEPARDRLLIAMGIDACWLGYQELLEVLEGERSHLLEEIGGASAGKRE